jgi:hypothetical protein
MSLSEFLKHYGLSAKELKSILKVNRLDSNLRFVKTVPEEWIVLLDKHSRLLMPESDKNFEANKKDIVKIRLKGVKLNSLASLEELKAVESEDRFMAYVKYIAEDGSHAFLKRINGIDDLNRINLNDLNEDDF